jgi:hypothetical protein
MIILRTRAGADIPKLLIHTPKRRIRAVAVTAGI